MEESTPNTPNTPDIPSTPKAKKKAPVGLIAGLTAAALAAAVVGGYFGLCAWVKDNGCLLPGTVAVDDRGEAVADLGRLSREDALSVVSQEMDQRLDNRTLTLLYGDGKKKELTGDLMTISPEAAVEAGFFAKEEQSLWKLGALWLGAAQEPCQMSLSAAAFTEEGAAQAKKVIQSIADEVKVDPVDFTYEVEEETVTVTPGTDGQRLDTDALLDAVEEALAQGETELRVEPEPVPGAELSGTVIRDLVHVEPQAPGVDKDGKLTPAIIGRTVDPQEAQKLRDAAEPGQPVSIPLDLIPPDTTGDERLYYKDLLATVSSYVDGDVSRTFNVNLAATRCNGKVIQPGEVFSYLSAINIDNGYRIGTGYENGLTVPMYGGGVCQVSSCIYYCAVYSNLEIVKRANHAFATGYIPNGLDATVYSPNLDFKFRNNSGFPIKIVAYMADRQLTVQIYGSNPDGIRVETQRYTQSSTAWTTVYQPDETIPRGTTRVKITPYTGYVVDVYRCVYDANGNLISRTFENHSKYNKRDKVILYNPADEGPWGPGTDPGVEPTPEIPPATEPPITQPPVTEPPVTQPPVTDPPVTDPPVTEPPATDPPVEPTPEPPPTQYIDLPGHEMGA